MLSGWRTKWLHIGILISTVFAMINGEIFGAAVIIRWHICFLSQTLTVHILMKICLLPTVCCDGTSRLTHSCLWNSFLTISTGTSTLNHLDMITNWTLSVFIDIFIFPIYQVYTWDIDQISAMSGSNRICCALFTNMYYYYYNSIGYLCRRRLSPVLFSQSCSRRRL